MALDQRFVMLPLIMTPEQMFSTWRGVIDWV